MRTPKRLYTPLLIVLALIMAVAVVGRSPVLAQEGVDQEKLEQGAQLFATNCAACHGENGEGRVGATLSKEWPSIRPDLTVEAAIRNGVPGSVMPAWSQANGGPLSDEDIDALVYYILSWTIAGPPDVDLPEPTQVTVMEAPPGVEGDPNNGALLYAGNCVACHGEKGEGRIGATLAKDWPSIRPDLTVRNVIANGVSGTLMPAWSQANGGPLNDSELDDLTAYIMTWEDSPSVQPSGENQQTPGDVGGELGWIILAVAAIVLVGGGIYLGLRRPGSR